MSRFACILPLVLALVSAGCTAPPNDGDEDGAPDDERPAQGDADGDASAPYDSASQPLVSLPGQYLLAFHTCPPGCTGDFREHSTHLATSEDGAEWKTLDGADPYKGSVPDVIRRGNTLYVYNPGELHRYHIETGTWGATRPVQMTHPDGTMESFVDPSPILDDDGRIVLFYLVGGAPGTGDPASCAPAETACTKRFRSATEVEGSDGTRFTVDEGDRVAVELDEGDQPRIAADPDVFAHPGGWVVYVSAGPNVRVYTSTTLRGTYAPVDGLTGGYLSHGSGGVPAGHYDEASGMYWTYVHQSGPGQPSVVRLARHERLDVTLSGSEFHDVVTAASLGLPAETRVESPGFSLANPD